MIKTRKAPSYKHTSVRTASTWLERIDDSADIAPFLLFILYAVAPPLRSLPSDTVYYCVCQVQRELRKKTTTENRINQVFLSQYMMFDLPVSALLLSL